MHIFRHVKNVPEAFRRPVLAIGDFDGVHLGHRSLLAQARREAERRNRPLAVLSFEPRHGEACLTPLRVKTRLLAGQGVAALFLMRRGSALPAGSRFPEDVLLGELGVCAVVTSEDCSPDFATLTAMAGVKNVAVIRAKTLSENKEEISATRIRAALQHSRPDEARRLLGWGWAIEGRVLHGDKRGRALSFPTANMLLGNHVAPARGIYAVRAKILDRGRVIARHDGVANFGVRPMYRTISPLLETHLFDFDGDLYGKYLSVELVAWLRPEAHFANPPELIAQMGKDAAGAREILSAAPICSSAHQL